MKRSLVVLAIIVLALAGQVQAQDPAPEVSSLPVTGSVHMLIGRGGNIAVSVGADATFIVDDKYAPMTPAVVSAIAQLTSKPVRFVLNTHFHPDHTGGNEALGKAGALIVAHDNVRRRLSSEQLLPALNAHLPPAPQAALPVVTFSDTITFHINGDEVFAFHVDAAHTDGDAIVVWRKANVIHMGDIYWSNGYPLIDVENGGTIDGMIAAAERVLAVSDRNTRIIPGHGPLSNAAELRGFRDALAIVRSRVQQQIAAGRSLQQVLAGKPSADLDAKWGHGFIKPDHFVASVYRTSTRNR